MSKKKDPTKRPNGGVTRRGFLGSVSAGAVVAATGVARPAEAIPEITSPEEMVRVALMINGRIHRLLVEPRWTLLFVLRERLAITGTKAGCERGECGSCTVLIDGQPRYACMTLAVEAEGTEVTTVEGLLDGEELGTVQKAFVEEDAFQCGYCTPGQVMAAEGLLRINPSPTFDEIRCGMSGNLCRCGAYPHIVNAVTTAAENKKGGQ
ncbi:MAG: (2Fe-2S)-binding protein [Acidobacteria bacterium]|nr:(2Fe-2S)-binding protein [Candidatus Sulfomarinibacter kjeldsenii]MBD3858051.1 (2Fe-2S)-binding protein [Candidatus Sulfomarinibacter kjeldsenii]